MSPTSLMDVKKLPDPDNKYNRINYHFGVVRKPGWVVFCTTRLRSHHRDSSDEGFELRSVRMGVSDWTQPVGTQVYGSVNPQDH